MSTNGTTTTEEAGSWGLLGRLFTIPSYVWSGVEPTVNTVEVPVIEEKIVEVILTPSQILEKTYIDMFDIDGDGQVSRQELLDTISKFSKEKPSEYANAFIAYAQENPGQAALYSVGAAVALYIAAKVAIGATIGATKGLYDGSKDTVNAATFPVRAPITWALAKKNATKALTGPEASKPFAGTTREAAFAKLDADSPFVKWMSQADASVVAVVAELKDKEFAALTTATNGFVFGTNSSGHSISTTSADNLRRYFEDNKWLEPRKARKKLNVIWDPGVE